MILSFWTDRSGQTVQTQIRLLLEVRYSLVKPSCSNFRVIVANFLVWVSEYLGFYGTLLQCN